MSQEIAGRARRRVGPRSAGLLMTPEEFDALPGSRLVGGYRYELIRGILIVTPAPGNAEIDPNQYLGYLLLMHQEGHPDGSIIDKTLPEQTLATAANRRRCDRAIWVGLGRVPDPGRDVPAIVVEFVSASRRDRRRDYEEKRDEYLAAGVLEYWIVDRFQRNMTVYRPGPDGPVATAVPASGTYTTGLLPGFSLPLNRLLAKADDWPSRRRRKPPTGADR